jgi:phosphatidylglycerol:prolipoprotein diacylglycerol transferase
MGIYKDAGRLADLPAWERLPGMGFHDLGWYEFLFTLGVICPAFLLLDRKPRAAGFFPLLFLSLYIPVRFVLDFLRIVDVRYAGLTPGQWAALAAIPVVGWATVRVGRRREPPPEGGSGLGAGPGPGPPPG